jgi:hypothetical protein
MLSRDFTISSTIYNLSQWGDLNNQLPIAYSYVTGATVVCSNYIPVTATVYYKENHALTPTDITNLQNSIDNFVPGTDWYAGGSNSSDDDKIFTLKRQRWSADKEIELLFKGLTPATGYGAVNRRYYEVGGIIGRGDVADTGDRYAQDHLDFDNYRQQVDAIVLFVKVGQTLQGSALIAIDVGMSIVGSGGATAQGTADSLGPNLKIYAGSGYVGVSGTATTSGNKPNYYTGSGYATVGGSATIRVITSSHTVVYASNLLGQAAVYNRLDDTHFICPRFDDNVHTIAPAVGTISVSTPDVISSFIISSTADPFLHTGYNKDVVSVTDHPVSIICGTKKVSGQDQAGIYFTVFDSGVLTSGATIFYPTASFVTKAIGIARLDDSHVVLLYNSVGTTNPATGDVKAIVGTISHSGSALDPDNWSVSWGTPMQIIRLGYYADIIEIQSKIVAGDSSHFLVVTIDPNDKATYATYCSTSVAGPNVFLQYNSYPFPGGSLQVLDATNFLYTYSLFGSSVAAIAQITAENVGLTCTRGDVTYFLDGNVMHVSDADSLHSVAAIYERTPSNGDAIRGRAKRITYAGGVYSFTTSDTEWFNSGAAILRPLLLQDHWGVFYETTGLWRVFQLP